MGTTKFLFSVCFVTLFLESESTNLDIVLLLDSSDLVRSPMFLSEKRFTTDFIQEAFTTETQISVSTFGKQTDSQFLLNTYTQLEEFKQAVKYMWYTTGEGNVETAIESILSSGFTANTGDRECAPNVLVILTHSPIKNTSSAYNLAQVAKSKKIKCVVINMAGTAAVANFRVFTNDSTDVVDIESFQALETSAQRILQTFQNDHFNSGCGYLTAWSNWTSCSATCGIGSRFRTRKCQKNTQSDRDCNGVLIETTPCNLKNCIDPVDGLWSNWQHWDACSKTCDSGNQRRIRLCDEPSPSNGGKTCPGSNTQSRLCAEWTCPDCGRICSPGGHLSSDCHVCQCSGITLFGQILDDTKHPVSEANIFLESSRYKPFATTDSLGEFNASGVCIMNERVFVEAKNCESKHFDPTELNATHWTLQNASLLRYVLPVITVQPQGKTRMIGQDLTLCCVAIGRPQPTSYKWFKNGTELENVGNNGTLILSSLKRTDAAEYKCYTETIAGVTLSDEVKVEILDGTVDTCEAPKEFLQDLPHGCYLMGDQNKSNVINIGSCGKNNCMKSSLHDNGSCSDRWPYHCCDVKDIQTVDIICEGFGYKLSLVKSCECKPCQFKTTLAGLAFGRANGSEIPFQLGKILVNGKTSTLTNMAGFFTFNVPKGTRRVVATFHGDTYKKFLDVTKVIQISEGEDTFVSVVVPLKPEPIPFSSANGTEVHLGGNSNDMPPAGKLSIYPDSIITADGRPFNGTVKAMMHFMDPRKMEDIEAANGEFESETPGGEKRPLKTFGMFKLALSDNNGDELRISKPLKFSLDASLFKVPHDEHGEPDLAMWNYDSNKGTWVEIAKMKYEQSANGQRKLLQSGSLFAEFDPKGIPMIDHETTQTIQVFTGQYTNCDHSQPIYTYVETRGPKDGSCFAKVSVYTDMTLKEPYSMGNIELKAYVKSHDNSSFIGYYSMANTKKNGKFCVPVFCNCIVYITVIKEGKEKLWGKHILPDLNIIRSNFNNTVEFESIDFGNSLDCSSMPGMKSTFECRGPMYAFAEQSACSHAGEDSFQFKFAPFTKAPVMNYVEKGSYDKKLSWYPTAPDKATFRSCFMKMRMHIEGNHGIRILAKSHLTDFNREEFGSYEVGPTPDPLKQDEAVRGACFEFRCPGYIKDGGKEDFSQPTAVEVRIITSNRTLTCFWNETKQGLNVTTIPNTNGNIRGHVGFRFFAEAGNNYGTKFGVFVHDKPATDVLRYCNSGQDTGPELNGLMNPYTNAAVVFRCV